MTARFDNRVLSTLRFKMIFCLAKSDTSSLLEVPQHFSRKIDMAIQACAYGRSTERKLPSSLDRFLRAFFGVSKLLRVTGEFLGEPHRRRHHLVRAANL